MIFEVIAFIFLIGLIVLVHELGHFIAAKRFGVFCGEFSLGMGPLLLKKQIGETQYSLRLLPIGGFVAMAGEEDNTKKDIEVPYERTINGIKTYKKIIVMLAGIFMNIMLAWVIFIGLNIANPERSLPGPATLETVQANTPAAEAGFEVGDTITQIELKDGKIVPISSSNDLINYVAVTGDPITYTVKRGNEIIKLTASALKSKEADRYLLGVGFVPGEVKNLSIIDAFTYGTKDLVRSSTLLFESIGSLLRGNNLDQLSGPVGIFKISSQAASAGMATYFQLIAIFSINIGIMNALPLPVLDGGRALLAIIEKIYGRKINDKLMNYLMWGGVILLIGLMLFATFNDILRMF